MGRKGLWLGVKGCLALSSMSEFLKLAYARQLCRAYAVRRDVAGVKRRERWGCEVDMAEIVGSQALKKDVWK